MEILSDTVFRGGMQAKSVTVGNVNITSDSVVVPSLYANTLLLCGGSKSISDFADITKYVDVGSGSISGGDIEGSIEVHGNVGSQSVSSCSYALAGSYIQCWGDIAEHLDLPNLPLSALCGTTVVGKYDETSLTYPFRLKSWKSTADAGYNAYNIFSHCGFRTPWGIQVGYDYNDISSPSNSGGGYINFNGQTITKWEDICVYLSAYFNNSGSSGGSGCGNNVSFTNGYNHYFLTPSDKNVWFGAGIQVCGSCQNGIKVGSDSTYTTRINDYVGVCTFKLSLNGNVISNWTDLSNYINTSTGGNDFPKYCNAAFFKCGIMVDVNGNEAFPGVFIRSLSCSNGPMTTITREGIATSEVIASYISVGGNTISRWSDISKYLNGGSEFTCTSETTIKRTEFQYPSWIGHLLMVDGNTGCSSCFYLPGAGQYYCECSGSTRSPLTSDCLSSTNYTPRDDELALVGWVKNNISGGSSSSSSGLKLYNCLFSDYQFDIPAGCTRFVFHTIENVSPNDIGPIEIRVCADSNSYAGIYKIDDVFGYGSSLWPTTDGHGGTDIIVLRDSSDAKTVYTPRVVTTIQQ